MTTQDPSRPLDPARRILFGQPEPAPSRLGQPPMASGLQAGLHPRWCVNIWVAPADNPDAARAPMTSANRIVQIRQGNFSLVDLIRSAQ